MRISQAGAFGGFVGVGIVLQAADQDEQHLPAFALLSALKEYDMRQAGMHLPLVVRQGFNGLPNPFAGPLPVRQSLPNVRRIP